MTVIEQLIELQEVDGRIRELESELKDLPRRKALETARLSGVSSDLAGAQANKEYIQSRAAQFEKDAEALRDKIQQMKISLATAESQKEYIQLSTQIDLLEHELEATESNNIAVLDDMPAAEAKIVDAQSRYDELKLKVDEVCKELDERISAANALLASAMEERKEKTAKISDPQARLYYERLRTKRWPVVATLNQSGVCDGCHLVQPPSVAQLVDANLRNGKDGKQQKIVACTMCGRILYRS